MNRLERDCELSMQRVEILAELFAQILVDDDRREWDDEHSADVISLDRTYGADGPDD